MSAKKVENKKTKEKIRKGTKSKNHIAKSGHNKDIKKFTNKIINDDSFKVLNDLPENSVDIIITSPPYNFGLSYDDDSTEDTVNWTVYFARLKKMWELCHRVLKPSGRICINVQPLFSDYMPSHHIISSQLLEIGFLWKGEILWEKNNYNCKYTAWGSWKSPSMPYLKYTWEFVEIFSKETHKKIGDKKNIDITADEFKKWVYAKWSIAPERNMKKLGHPAMFPEELVMRLLKLFSYQGDIVLDPFNGVGTTTLVCKKLKRKFIGIDISSKYCEVAKRRLKEPYQENLFN